MSRIVLAGGWLWGWGAWHAVWLGTLLWGGVVLLHGGDPRWVFTVFAGLYTVFFPMELAGVRGNRIHRDGRARTLSEFRQFLPVTMTDGTATPAGAGSATAGSPTRSSSAGS